jgi:hypothetical protein
MAQLRTVKSLRSAIAAAMVDIPAVTTVNHIGAASAKPCESTLLRVGISRHERSESDRRRQLTPISAAC